MTLTELRYIVAVAQEKHFGRAAQRCHVSQPTLSIAIKKLEEELGVSLFDRSSSEILMTESGAAIVSQAQRVLEEAEVIRHLANAEQNQLEGSFRLGLIFTVAPYLLPRLIVSMRHVAPKMPLFLEENYTAVLTDLLKRGELDAVVVAEPYAEAGIETIALYDEPFFVIVPKGHPFEELDSVSTAGLVYRAGGKAENCRIGQYAARKLAQHHPPYGGQRLGHQRTAVHRHYRQRPFAVFHRAVQAACTFAPHRAGIPPQFRPPAGCGGHCRRGEGIESGRRVVCQ